jgi:hypothetical protein
MSLPLLAYDYIFCVMTIGVVGGSLMVVTAFIRWVRRVRSR